MGIRKLIEILSACSGPELEGQFDDVFVFFAHADDAPRTHFQPSLTDRVQGLQPVIIGMGRTNTGIKAAARVEVVVHPIHARGLQPLSLLRGEQSQRRADMQAEGLLDPGDDLGDPVQLGLGRAAAGSDDAIRSRLPLGRLLAPA